MPHHWMSIALGRVCNTCLVAQRTGEFDENVPCARDASAGEVGSQPVQKPPKAPKTPSGS